MIVNQYIVKRTKPFSNPYTNASNRDILGQTYNIIYYEECDSFYRCGVMIIFTLILFKG